MTGRPLYLIGFMASGKTTLGRALAARLQGYRFVDLDQAVEESEGMSVSEIFAAHGADYFRQAENNTLRRESQPGCIIACGGGTPCFADNMDYMLANGYVVWLQADDDVTARRLRLAPGQRPLVDSLLDRPDELKAHIRRLRTERTPFYSRADAVFDSNRLEDEDQIEESCRIFIDRLLLPSNKTQN